MFFDNPNLPTHVNRENGFARAKTLLTILIVVFLFAFLRAEGSLGNWLASGQSRAEIMQINKDLNKEIQEVVSVNHANEAQRQAVSETKEIEREILTEVAAQVKENKKVVVQKKEAIKKKVAVVQEKVKKTEITPEQEEREIVAIIADTIWDDYCADNPDTTQCLNDKSLKG